MKMENENGKWKIKTLKKWKMKNCQLKTERENKTGRGKIGKGKINQSKE